jgi:hypothetical protein
VWQRLYEELEPAGFTVISVALDSRGNEAAGPWIERASPTYPCLVDRTHLVADLYGFVNVPMAVWIDEQGMVVRGPEPAGTTDAFRQMDRTGYSMPEEARNELRSIRSRYMAAIHDWVQQGPASRFAQAAPAGHPSNLRRALPRFMLGQFLFQQGNHAEATSLIEEALAIAPESWAIRRQAWALEDPAKAGGPEFWAAVDALGDDRYYPKLALDDET